MAAFFLDTSALAKRYVIETGSGYVINLTDPKVGNDWYAERDVGSRKRNGAKTEHATLDATSVASVECPTNWWRALRRVHRQEDASLVRLRGGGRLSGAASQLGS